MGNALGTPPNGPSGLPRGQTKPENGSESSRRNFTPPQLAEFNGSHGKPIYVSLLSEVFDVSESSDYLFGPGGKYHALAGKDASRALATNTLSDASINNLDLSDLTDQQLQVLNDWVTRFRDENKFPIVGRLVVPMDLTRDELRQYTGLGGLRGTTLIALNGTIFDVTLNGLAHYGPDGAYSQFAGRDASRALALMSLDDECLDDPRLDDLSDVQKSSLSDWATRFQQKYAPIGKLLQ
jgi:membrane-associated progesterone receptor component